VPTNSGLIQPVEPLGQIAEEAGVPYLVDARHGIMLVTGMIIGSCFTLFVVPSVYALVARTYRAAKMEEAEVVGELEPAAV
jgi:hypothetical protein